MPDKQLAARTKREVPASEIVADSFALSIDLLDVEKDKVDRILELVRPELAHLQADIERCGEERPEHAHRMDVIILAAERVVSAS